MAQSISRRNLNQEVTDRIQHLPPASTQRPIAEPQLAEQFGVGRTAVSEAVKTQATTTPGGAQSGGEEAW